jgi:hypothetical protein
MYVFAPSHVEKRFRKSIVLSVSDIVFLLKTFVGMGGVGTAPCEKGKAGDKSQTEKRRNIRSVVHIRNTLTGKVSTGRSMTLS